MEKRIEELKLEDFENATNDSEMRGCEQECEAESEVDQLRKLLIWLYFFANRQNNPTNEKDMQSNESYTYICPFCRKCTIYDSYNRLYYYRKFSNLHDYFSLCLEDECLQKVINQNKL